MIGQTWHPVLQALMASLFTWAVTALGAALVFVFPSSNRMFLDASLGFAAGVMIAASFWSLLAPAIEICQNQVGALAFVPVAIGFTIGAFFVHLSDKMMPSELEFITITETPSPKTSSAKERNSNSQYNEDASFELRRRHVDDAVAHTTTTTHSSTPLPSTDVQQLSWRRIMLLLIAVTVHNFPEGLAVGVGFGGVGKTPSASFENARNLALGIGLQNFPEGLAISLPLAAFGFSRARSFLYGQLSGMVEPVAALLGASLVLIMESVLPYALSFAAGAMVYVVFDSIIPESYSHGNGKLSSTCAIFGFLVMMSLEVGTG